MVRERQVNIQLSLDLDDSVNRSSCQVGNLLELGRRQRMREVDDDHLQASSICAQPIAMLPWPARLRDLGALTR